MTSKPIWESKTFWFNALSIAAAVLMLVAGTDGLGLSEPVIKWVLLVVAAINIGLRMMSTQPVSLTGDDKTG